MNRAGSEEINGLRRYRLYGNTIPAVDWIQIASGSVNSIPRSRALPIQST